MITEQPTSTSPSTVLTRNAALSVDVPHALQEGAEVSGRDTPVGFAFLSDWLHLARAMPYVACAVLIMTLTAIPTAAFLSWGGPGQVPGGDSPQTVCLTVSSMAEPA